MIENKKIKRLAVLSATPLLFAATANQAHANESMGQVTANILNVRSGPSTSYSVIGGLKKGEKVQIISSKNSWYNVKYGNKTGWVSGSYVSLIDSSNTNSTTTNKKVIATASLNVRSGGSTEYKIVGYIGANKTVDMLGVASTGWYKVKLSNGTIGYASNKYLKEVSDNSNNTTSDNSNSTNNNNNSVTNDTSNNITVIDTLVSTVTLNLRSGPSTSNNLVGVIYKNEKVSVLEKTNNYWYKVKLSNGKIGYCYASYLKSQSQIDSVTNKPSSSDDVAYTIDVKSYAYYTGTITATGTTPTFGRTIAVDPTVIPYGTRVYIKEFDKTFIAEDCGGAIKGNKIDIYMNTKEECINWGVRNLTLYILK